MKKRKLKSPKDKCIELAKKIVRMKANYKCAYCGLGEPRYRTHGSHIYGVGAYPDMSADLDNILCLCATHHIGGYWKNSKEVSWHESPMEMTEWFREKYPERHRQLKIRTQTIIKNNWEEKLRGLREIFKKLEEVKVGG